MVRPSTRLHVHVMDILIAGLTAGILGTLVMDALNLLFARAGLISRIDVAMIGRMAMGWARGRFRYAHPGEIEACAHETPLGYGTHYAIGVTFAFAYLLGWELLVGTPPSPLGAGVYGLATTVASWFLVFPSMGMGALGRRSPEGRRAPLSSLANHLFYGLGLALGIALA